MTTSSNLKVIACGHRHIQTKSGNSFPALLIRIPGHHSDHSEDRYFWRSKRDFLVLNRFTPHPFPKKAFAKLSDQAISGGSWVRIDDDEAPPEGYCSLIRNLNGDVGDMNNNFFPNMKKSLQQLDQFLSKASTASKKATIDNDDNENSSIVKAWNVFCKPEHTTDLTNISSATSSIYETHTPTAAQLGQYFASDENARLVVSKMLELLESDEERSTNDSLVFVEPSCGDGRILSELLNTTKQIQADSITIMGYDIDPTAIERAKARLSGSEVYLECKDFLSASRLDLLSSISTSSNVNEEESLSRKRRRAIVIGGPPYTPKKLPQQFILHSIQQLNADIIVFILPERCKKDADQLQKTLNSSLSSEATRSWSYSNTELKNIEFSFQNSTVQQPSVLQCWYQV